MKWLAVALLPAIIACSSPGARPIDAAIDSVDAGFSWDTVELPPTLPLFVAHGSTMLSDELAFAAAKR